MAKFFKTDFAPYVCEGDSISCEHEGVTYYARLVRDLDSTPLDYTSPGWCFDLNSKQYGRKNQHIIDSWKRDEWHYFTVVIDAERDGWRKTDIASLSGVEGNFPSRAKNPNRYLREVANNLMLEVIEQVSGEAVG